MTATTRDEALERALLRRYYGIDPLDLTFPQYVELIQQIPKIERLFNPPPEGPIDHKAIVEARNAAEDGITPDPIASERAMLKQIFA